MKLLKVFINKKGGIFFRLVVWVIAISVLLFVLGMIFKGSTFMNPKVLALFG